MFKKKIKSCFTSPREKVLCDLRNKITAQINQVTIYSETYEPPKHHSQEFCLNQDGWSEYQDFNVQAIATSLYLYAWVKCCVLWTLSDQRWSCVSTKNIIVEWITLEIQLFYSLHGIPPATSKPKASFCYWCRRRLRWSPTDFRHTSKSCSNAAPGSG